MNVRHPMGVLHSFSIKKIFYDKMDSRLFYFDLAKSAKKSILNLKKSNRHKACSFTNTFCFIDDLCAINGNVLFKAHFK